MPTMPSIGAKALGAQLEQRVSGSCNHDSMPWIVASSRRWMTDAEG